jgi:LacI family transcriptional regulator
VQSISPIVVLIQTSDAVGRQLHQGIFRYARPGKLWKIHTDEPDHAGLARAIEWRPRGIIARTVSVNFSEQLQQIGCPVVNVDDVSAGIDLPHVGKDEEAIGRMAAEHFLERGFRNFAFIGTNSPFRFAQRREQSFVEWLRRAGRTCTVHRHDGGWPAFFSPRKFWDRQGRKLSAFLRDLPKPLAVFAYTDLVGRWTIDLCADTGLAVPDQIAVLSAENDDLICQSTYPPLSAVMAPLTEVGFAAARMLDQLMTRQARGHNPRTPKPVYIAPHAVAERLSTETLAVDDPDIVTALRMIRDNAGRPLDVKQLLHNVPVSRRTLEKRFRRALGRTPRQEIERVAIRRAMGLLADTDVPMKQVALDAGFSSAVRFAITFRRAVGMTPSAYRSRHSTVGVSAP